jgi:hypothetical protein
MIVARRGIERVSAALLPRMVHHAGQQLHRHVLEGERRTVEQLQHKEIVADLHERTHCRMAEAGIGRYRAAVVDDR